MRKMFNLQRTRYGTARTIFMNRHILTSHFSKPIVMHASSSDANDLETKKVK